MIRETNPILLYVKLTGILLVFLVSAACSASQPIPTDSPTPSPLAARPTNSAGDTITITPTQESDHQETTALVTLTPESSTDSQNEWKIHTNDEFGLSFGIPPAWFGPDEYVWENGLRLAVGSDVVYPYGTDRTEQIYQVKNSYYVTIQYTLNRNNWSLEQYRTNQPWTDTYFSLLELNDGESLSSPRSLVTRVRGLKLGRFEGLEYISTLSETAQTEPFFAREVVLWDPDLNTLTVTGSPNNVEVAESSNWREAYRQVDAVNLDTFYEILQSITVD